MTTSAPRFLLYILLPSLIGVVLLWTNCDKYMREPQIKMESESSKSLKFSYVSGYFTHDLQPTGPERGFRAETLPAFGLLNRTYDTDEDLSVSLTQWQRFERLIEHLNRQSVNSTQHKVIFVARHGEGVHNVKEKEVGRHEWERYWSRLEGDGNVIWLDAHLTAKGIQQAQQLGEFWKDAFETAKTPLPDVYYTSPLTRCLETVHATFSMIEMPEGKRFRPIVKEALREITGVHTCDKRRSRSWIETAFPNYEIEPGLTEVDELWSSNRRETLEEHAALVTSFLTEVFEDDETTFISLTTHSGAIRALYLATGHPDVWVAPGAVVPVVIRRER